MAYRQVLIYRFLHYSPFFDLFVQNLNRLKSFLQDSVYSCVHADCFFATPFKYCKHRIRDSWINLLILLFQPSTVLIIWCLLCQFNSWRGTFWLFWSSFNENSGTLFHTTYPRAGKKHGGSCVQISQISKSMYFSLRASSLLMKMSLISAERVLTFT